MMGGVLIGILHDGVQAAKDMPVLKDTIRERDVLKVCDHPHIVKLLFACSDEKFTYIGMQSAKDGDLFSYTIRKNGLPTLEVKTFMYQIASALEYLHNINIIHCDVSTENILLDMNKTFAILCDFKYASSPGKVTDGRLCHMSPEILLGDFSYDDKRDVWAYGCTMYEMMTARSLFDSNDAQQTCLAIIEYDGVPDLTRFTDTLQKQLLFDVLTIDHSLRCNMQHVLAHPWFVDDDETGFDSPSING